ncbi:cell envelope integrity protein TolA [Sulfurirhabdus autotrophica]|uniref:Cell division and transport-associated protein TolA n=1 Tax=Sulfurirhabdus autotrophica TaxID=1706046 RepID=A0A4R3XXN7_9PROT|nr:cell envelope integrity protein TolA [Sulfurirhabdus autotrophica]TCV83797.1 cell division and transport-associated protein TolA [Sulfurirhabdus autotrophica]
MWGREEPGKRLAGFLAVFVHLLFFGLLIFGVNWHSKQPEAMSADLWSALPPAQKPVKELVAKPKPVEPTPPKETPKPPPEAEVVHKPKPEPKVEPKPPVVKPDIALKEKEKKRLKEEKQKEEELKQKQEELKQKQEAQKRKQEQEKLKKQQLQEQQAAKEAEAQLQREQAAANQAAQAASQSKVNDFKNRIQSKIKRFIILPSDMQGNPQAEFDVILLPSGDVLSVKLTRSSGNAVYDSAVERAIYKAQPLPLPPEPSLFSKFRELHLQFRPNE